MNKEINQKTVGQMPLSEAIKHLEPIAKSLGLRLNRVKEFNMARIILVNLYNRELT